MEQKIRSDIINLNIEAGPSVGLVASAESIPLLSDSVDFPVAQETLEHIFDHVLALEEFHRVLKKGGVGYLQVPFIIGAHPDPSDYRRFTSEGLQRDVEAVGFRTLEIGLSVGGASGFYRILVEFMAILTSGPVGWLYRPMKGIFATALFPIKILDYCLATSAKKSHRRWIFPGLRKGLTLGWPLFPGSPERLAGIRGAPESEGHSWANPGAMMTK